MRRCVPALTGFTMFLAAAFVTSAQSTPETLRPPANEQLLSQVHAKGEQIYSCKADGAQFAWTLKGVEAQLADKDGKPFGKHYTGPTWEANDGSRLTGKAAANYPSPEKDSIPWLLVSVVSHSGGEGALTKVTSIQRLNTKGGKAPADGCDKAHVDKEVRVPYTADYLFFAPK
jgi:hypothetical protein